MRSLLVWFALALASAPVRADDAGAEAIARTPPLDEALAQAAREDKPLIVEFGAAWCKPCRTFEQHVLARPAVIAALRRVVFVRYDVDTREGAELAERYRIEGLPTFLVLGAGGVERYRHAGLPGAPDAIAAWFVRLIATAAAPSHLDALEAAVAARPDDADARLRLAHARRSAGQLDAALADYRAVVAAASAGERAVAEATAAIAELDGARARVAAVVDSHRSFVAAFPGSPLSARRLAVLAASGLIDRRDLGALLGAHLDAVAEVDRPGALQVALALGEVDRARAALARWAQQVHDPQLHALLQAELALHARDHRRALQATNAGCRGLPRAHARTCLDLETGLRTRTGSPAVARLRAYGTAVLADLREPGTRSSLVARDLDALEPALGNAVAHALLVAERACVGWRRGPETVGVALALAPAGGAPLAVRTTSATAELDSCMRDHLATAALPAAPVGAPANVSVVLRLPPREDFRDYPGSRPIDNGMLAFLARRRGTLETMEVGVTSMLDVTRLAQFRLTASVDASAGTAGSERAYQLAGLAGLAYAPRSRWAVMARVGVGVSAYGEVAPRALEIPIELRLRLAFDRFTTHAWARGVHVRGDAMREASTGRALFDADEIQVGLGASQRLGGEARVFAAAVYEDREHAQSWLLVAGVPFGRYF